MTSSRIVQLAREISESVAKIDSTLAEQGLPSLSFDEDAPAGNLPKELSSVRDIVIDATAELHDLLLDPLHLIKSHGGSNNSLCLQAIARYNIANIVPLGGRESFTVIGEKTGLGTQMATRLLRHAMTMHIFCEPEPGYVAHTQGSKLISTRQMNAWLGIGTGEMWPAATKMLDALEKWPSSQEPNETGFSLSQNSNMSIYDYVGSSPERGSRFADSMFVFATRPDYAPSHVVNGLDWASLSGSGNRDRVQVVDVGGAQGHVATALALQYPSLEVVVQDMDKVVEGAEKGLPEPLKQDGRVTFMAHDLFAPQAVKSADVYFFRWILHNWADKHCISILRAQIPALQPGAHIVIMDTIMPDPQEKESVAAVPLWIEKDLRSEDLNMGAIFNSRERTLQEWKNLVAEADPGFVWQGVSKPEGSIMALMHVKWSPES